MTTILFTELAAIGFAILIYLILAISGIGTKRSANKTLFQATEESFKEWLFMFPLSFLAPAGIALGTFLLKVRFLDSFIK